ATPGETPALPMPRIGASQVTFEDLPSSRRVRTAPRVLVRASVRGTRGDDTRVRAILLAPLRVHSRPCPPHELPRESQLQSPQVARASSRTRGAAPTHRPPAMLES